MRCKRKKMKKEESYCSCNQKDLRKKTDKRKEEEKENRKPSSYKLYCLI